jgi:DNA-binding transcriptional LysR family regulator
MRLDPVSLKLFVTVLEEGTIAAAAERENLVPAAVSKRLSEIESYLGTQLLVRSNKGITATAAGLALSSMARRVLHELDEITIQMREYASGVRGHVRVFANISAITQFLPNELKTFLEQYPQVQVHLEEKISTVITKSIAESAADIGIFTNMPHGHNLEVLPYHEDVLALIAPTGHPLESKERVRFEETLLYDYVGLHTGSAINHLLLQHSSELDRALKLRVQVTSYDALCLMVNSGLGIGLMPLKLAQHHARTLGLKVIALDEPWAHRELKLCVRNYDMLPVAAKLLISHLQGGHLARPR